MFCTRCGANNLDTNQVCTSCGSTLPLKPQSGSVPPPNYYPPPNPGVQQQPPYPGYQGFPQPTYNNPQMAPQNWQTMGADKKVPAGVLAILLGWLGIHKFILGYNTEGIILLVCSLLLGALTCGIVTGIVSIIGIIEGIIYLTKSDEEFVRTYIHNKKGWF